jgi:hypothetical protein
MEVKKTRHPDTEAQRSRLKLRQRPTGEWEVHASVHGTHVYRWWIISEAQKTWYQQQFPEIQIVPYEKE